jgi:isocitrate dehydrogenase
MDQPESYENVLALLNQVHALGLDIIKTENLNRFDGKLAFSLGQGQ